MLKQYDAQGEPLKGDREIIEAIKNGVAGAEVKDELLRIVAHREELESFLENTEEAPVLLHPNMSLLYQQEVNAPRASLKSSRAQSAELLRGLIDNIVLTPKTSGSGYTIDLHGEVYSLTRQLGQKLKL